jgi:hypothetical protein
MLRPMLGQAPVRRLADAPLSNWFACLQRLQSYDRERVVPRIDFPEPVRSEFDQTQLSSRYERREH